MDKTFESKSNEVEEKSIRPSTFSEYIGQVDLIKMLKVYVFVAKKRQEALDHIIFYGPPGLGKTTLANVIANEMNVDIIQTSAPSLTRLGDIVQILMKLKPGDILFIDEIHRLPHNIEELLYQAMEDYKIDIVFGKDVSSQLINYTLPPFTLIGATTRLGDLLPPFQDRFGIIGNLDLYTVNDLQLIINRTSKIFNYEITEEASLLIASRSRNTPRIANRLYKRVRDYAEYYNLKVIDYDICLEALKHINIDSQGLDSVSRNYLKCLVEKFSLGPVGLENISSTLGIDSNTITESCEPYLLKEGLIIRTPRGRKVTQKGLQHYNNIMKG